jgi:hypothetical protein
MASLGILLVPFLFAAMIIIVVVVVVLFFRPNGWIISLVCNVCTCLGNAIATLKVSFQRSILHGMIRLGW